MITLAEAIERKNWELVALLLMLGLSRLLAQMPLGSADDLLAVLEADDDGS